jgi:molybdate transport system regulatory protein
MRERIVVPDPNRTSRADVMIVRFFIRINFEPSGRALGPSVSDLLERIEKYGSIRKAAVSMGISYRKAWLLVHTVRQTLVDQF